MPTLPLLTGSASLWESKSLSTLADSTTPDGKSKQIRTQSQDYKYERREKRKKNTNKQRSRKNVRLSTEFEKQKERRGVPTKVLRRPAFKDKPSQ
jgi:hypothetical protein